jgi:hypothetical protein
MPTIPPLRRRARLLRTVAAVALLAQAPWVARASDHGDTDALIAAGRHDARIADFYVFTRGDNLVLAMTLVGDMPEPTAAFRFRSDVVYRFNIDRDTAVRFDNSEQVRLYGGTVSDPASIKEDVVIEVRFSADGTGEAVNVLGLGSGADRSVALFAGLRDEPFIRSTVMGKNIAAIVVELPLRRVVGDAAQPVLLAWATTDVAGVPGDQDDLGARAYRSMLADGQGLNSVHPSEHAARFNVPPDVVIFDTARRVSFPNGRDLEDDVVDLLGRPDGHPFPSANDLPFLDAFPYLPAPHPRPQTPSA